MTLLFHSSAERARTDATIVMLTTRSVIARMLLCFRIVPHLLKSRSHEQANLVAELHAMLTTHIQFRCMRFNMQLWLYVMHAASK